MQCTTALSQCLLCFLLRDVGVLALTGEQEWAISTASAALGIQTECFVWWTTQAWLLLPIRLNQLPQAVWCVETLGVAWPGSFMLMSTTIWTAGESIKPTLNTDLYVSGVNNAIAFDGNYTWTIKKNISALTQLMKPTDLSRLKPGTEGRDATRTLVTPLASLVFEAHLWSSISSHCHTHSL